MKVERAQAMELRPDDYLVVSVRVQLDKAQVDNACHMVSKGFGHRLDRVVVVDNGATFTVLRKVEGPSEK